MNTRVQRSIVPWDDLELAKIYQLLVAQGIDPERIQQVRPRQIVYSYSWTRSPKPSSGGGEDTVYAFRVSHSDPSIVTGLNASVIGGEVDIEGAWTRADDATVFSVPRNLLDYIRAQIAPNATTKLATKELPLSHLVNPPARGWMPALLDFVPGANFSAYEIVLNAPKNVWFDRLDISLTAVQLIGL